MLSRALDKDQTNPIHLNIIMEIIILRSLDEIEVHHSITMEITVIRIQEMEEMEMMRKIITATTLTTNLYKD